MAGGGLVPPHVPAPPRAPGGPAAGAPPREGRHRPPPPDGAAPPPPPAGTTINAIRELENHGVRAALIAALEAARDRSRELASGNNG